MSRTESLTKISKHVSDKGLWCALQGCTPLHYAVATKLDDVVDLLLSQDVDVNAADAKVRICEWPYYLMLRPHCALTERPFTAHMIFMVLSADMQCNYIVQLHFAIFHTNMYTDMVQGQTALHYATALEAVHIADMLLSHGADANLADLQVH